MNKIISQKVFQKAIAHMYGNTTCFVYDEPNNRYNCVISGVDDDTLDIFFSAESIEVKNLEDDSNVTAIMMSEFIAEYAPANNVQDDVFIPVIRKLFGEESKLYVATDGNNHKTFMLVY
jgi:hypothetical protein